MKFSENKNIDIKSRKIADSLVSDEFTYTGNMENARELLGKETEKQGLRGSDLAELTGWSPSKTSKLTIGRQKLTAEDIRVWARALGYTPDPFVDSKVDIRYYKLSEYVRSAGETVKAYIKTKIGTPKHTAIARYEVPLAILSTLGVTASDYAVRAKESYMDIVQRLNGGEGHTGTLIRFWQRTTSDNDGPMPEFCFCMSPSQDYILFVVYLNPKEEDGRIAELRRNCKETLKIEKQLTARFDNQADSYKEWLPKILRKGEIASIRLDIKDPLDTNKFEHDLIEIYEKYCDLIWNMKGMNLRSEKSALTDRSTDFSAEVKETVLQRENYKCENDSSHKTFRDIEGKTYMEVVPLIPFLSKKQFGEEVFSADNGVCLCPTCKAKMKYGTLVDREDMIYRLFKKHRKAMNDREIKVTLAQVFAANGVN